MQRTLNPTALRAIKHAYIIEVPEPFIYVDHLSTPSGHHVYEIQPGEYDIRWTNIGGDPWNPDPQVATPGYSGNIGPYYATARLDALLRYSQFENRLLGLIRRVKQTRNEPAQYSWQDYAYRVCDGAPAITTWIGEGRDRRLVTRAICRVHGEGYSGLSPQAGNV